MNNKKEKKHTILHITLGLLFVLCVTGIVGYGVYSYFYTVGRLRTGEERIEISRFKPILYNNGEFIGGNHELDNVECTLRYYDSDSLEAIYDCKTLVYVANEGSKDVEFELTNFQIDLGENIDSTRISASSVEVSGDHVYNYEPGVYSGIVEPKYGILMIWLKSSVQIYNMSVNPETISDDALYVDSPINGVDLKVTFSCDIKATEVHD